MDYNGRIEVVGYSVLPGIQRLGVSYPRYSEKAEGIFSMIPEGLDILVTHVPPHRILDLGFEGYNIGCEVLRYRLSQMKQPPRIHAFGHCHDQGGEQYFDGKTLFINAATVPVTVEL